jgi:hypothetical protein
MATTTATEVTVAVAHAHLRRPEVLEILLILKPGMFACLFLQQQQKWPFSFSLIT